MRPKPRAIMPGSTAWLAYTAPMTLHVPQVLRKVSGSVLTNGAAVGRAGIVDQDVDGAARRDRRLDCRLDRLRIGDVGDHEAGGVAGGDGVAQRCVAAARSP